MEASLLDRAATERRVESIEAWSAHLRSLRLSKDKIRCRLLQATNKAEGRCLFVPPDQHGAVFQVAEDLAEFCASPALALDNISWASRGRANMDVGGMAKRMDEEARIIHLLGTWAKGLADIRAELSRIDPHVAKRA